MLLVLLLAFGIRLAAQPADLSELARQGKKALAAGRHDDAARIYRAMVAQLPASGGLRLNLGLALFNAGKYRAAATELQTALQLEPGLAAATMMLGLCYAKLREPLAAIPLLEKALKGEPANAVVLLELADSYYATARFAPAIEHFRRLTELQPANPTAWRGLGLSLTEQSQSLFGKLAPGSAEALTLLARARLAADEPKAAVSLLRQALAANPAFPPAHGYLADLYTKAGHVDWAAASRAKAGAATGTFSEIAALSEQALAAFARLAALPPSVALYETQAEAAGARRAHPEAIEAWRKALSLSPRATNLERGLARALFEGRNFEEALPLLTKHGLTYELGESLLETGKANEAIPYLLKVPIPAAQAALGRAYLAVDQPAKAIAPLRAALDSDTDGSLHFQLARALQRTGAAAQAKEMDRISQQVRQLKADQQEAVGAVVIAPDTGITFAPAPPPGFVLEHSPSPAKYLPSTMGGGLAVFDFNNDGKPDLFFANGAELPSYTKSSPKYWNRLYRNDGNFRFTDVTAASGLAGVGFAFGAAAADYDNDGFVDLFVPALPASKLYRNNGDGTFTETPLPETGPWTIAAGWFDFDNDGRQDLFVVNYLNWSPANNPWCGDKTKNLRVYCHPRHFQATTNQLFRNKADGTFEDVSKSSGLIKFPGKGMSVTIADYDGDGNLDAFVTNDGLPNSLFRNKGNGTFEETAFAAGVALPDRGLAVSSMGTDFRDYDNDGRPDLIVTALAGESFPLFRNLGKGQFQEATSISRLAQLVARKSAWGVAIADFDNDGFKDLFTANSHVNDMIASTSSGLYLLANSVFQNRDGKSFVDVTAASPELAVRAAAHRGAVAADLDGDGRLDVVVTALGAPAQIWHNTTANGNRWVAVPAALNAVVKVSGQTNLASSSVGYSSSVVGPVHFGLGPPAPAN